jgi:hypothetical protein
MKKIIIILVISIIHLIALSQEYEYIPSTNFGAVWSEVFFP